MAVDDPRKTQELIQKGLKELQAMKVCERIAHPHFFLYARC
jgi:hypothetical protein